jgi:serine/threonine protein kinase
MMMPDLCGSRIGPYTLHGRLGHGAMAQVYRAADPSGQEVAVKALHPHLTDDAGFIDRFRREAEAASALEHPNIARVLDHGCEDGCHYLVMELIEGPSLRAWLDERDQPLAPVEAVTLAAALADIVAYAHSQGVVHRDLKPSNVLLRGGQLETPVLTDFGVARMVDATVATAADATLGTPAYMAPEQGQGQSGDGRSDIYALGVILYELAVGRPPFEADSPYALILRHIHTPPPPPRTLRPDLPPALEAVILRALEKDPASRYPSAAAFAAALRQSLALPQPPPKTWPLALVGLGALILLLLFAAWRLGWPPLTIGATGQAAAPQPILSTKVLQGSPAISDTWIDPDVPDRPAFDDGKVHLQGPSTPDRVLVRVALPEWPANTELLTATLSLYTVPWKPEDNRSAAVAAQRIWRNWDVTTATYESPWSMPGLEPGVDCEETPFITVTLTTLLTEQGWLDLDITAALRDWLAGQLNYGLALRLTDDSFGMAHLCYLLPTSWGCSVVTTCQVAAKS